MGISVAINLKPVGVKAMQAVAPRAWPSPTKFETKHVEKQAFDADAYFNSTGVARKVVEYGRNETVFLQGDPATSVLYIEKGGVKLVVVNEAGNEAVVAILGPGDYLGEKCLAGQPRRVCTAETIMPSTILVIEKTEMMRLLHTERAFSDWLIKHVLVRNIRAEEDLIDQLFNHSEKRLARALLLLVHYGEQGRPEKVLPKLSQETLAEMIGTTRSRVNLFMNRFRKLRFIEYKNQEIHINKSLLSVVLHD
jgi:CRP/FNR family transcriptional regulator, cyclic AMP receptor protein